MTVVSVDREEMMKAGQHVVAASFSVGKPAKRAERAITGNVSGLVDGIGLREVSR